MPTDSYRSKAATKWLIKTFSADCADHTDEGRPIRDHSCHPRKTDCIGVFEFLSGREDFGLL
jgi:hypothetical protein